MNIVANSFFLRNLRNLDFFRLNLGKTKKLINNREKPDSFRKVSEFELRYHNLYSRGLLIYGDIGGKVTFYEDSRMDQYKFLIFNEDDIYEIEWNNGEISNFRNYILETLRKVEQINDENEENNNEENHIEEYDNTWVAKDDKNRNKKYLINQNLSREEYRKELLKFHEKK